MLPAFTKLKRVCPEQKLCLAVRHVLVGHHMIRRSVSTVLPASILLRAGGTLDCQEDTQHMRSALKAASESTGVPIGAVVVSSDGQILSAAANDDSVAFRHAELVALELACSATGQRRLDGCSLFCTVEPCVMCFGAINLSRIRRLIYGCKSPKYGAFTCGAVDPAKARGVHQLLVTGGVCELEAADQLRRFFAQRRASAPPVEAAPADTNPLI